MVAPLSPHDTSQWKVLEWAFAQGVYNTVAEQSVLVYLTYHAFFVADNPEGGEVGQVMRAASYVGEIKRGTGLRSDTAVRNALNSLQSKGYVQRVERKEDSVYGQKPNLIYVLWDAVALQEGLRDGSRRLPSELLLRPTKKPPKAPERPSLELVTNYERPSLNDGKTLTI